MCLPLNVKIYELRATTWGCPYIEFIESLSRASLKFKQTFEQIYVGVDPCVYPKEKNEIF